MAFLFGGARPQGQDQIKVFTQDLKRSVRSTEREIARMDSQEPSLLNGIKRCKNEMDARDKARELVRMRAHRDRLQGLRSNLMGLSQQLQEIEGAKKTQNTVACMTVMLAKINKDISASQAVQLGREFEKQTTTMAMKQEAISDSLESTFQQEGEDQAVDSAVTGVLAEAGLELSLKSTPLSTRDTSLESLEERLKALSATT